MVLQDVEAHVAKVLVGDVLQQVHRLDFLAFALRVGDEIGESLVVAPRLLEDAAQGLVARVGNHRILCVLAGFDVGVAQRVLLGYTAVVDGAHLDRHFGQHAGRGGGYHVEFEYIALACLVVEGDSDVLLFARFEDLEAELAVFGGVGHHIT